MLPPARDDLWLDEEADPADDDEHGGGEVDLARTVSSILGQNKCFNRIRRAYIEDTFHH